MNVRPQWGYTVVLMHFLLHLCHLKVVSLAKCLVYSCVTNLTMQFYECYDGKDHVGADI